MTVETPWQKAAAAGGTTSSERLLALLAKRAFLSLWSYPNVYTDEGRKSGKGDGKELCDLLVVFGDYVLLFSDKDCHFQTHVDVNVAWPRWYKAAVARSAKQLSGAEKFLKAYPQRVFTDKQCEHPLPVPLPPHQSAKYFLIAVTRGSHFAAREYFGKRSSGTLMLDTSIEGDSHFDKPFRIGFPLPMRRFVHVIDELAIDLLLDELDTVADFVRYLEHKERLLQPPGDVVMVPGEEELLARYMATPPVDGTPFPKRPNNGSCIAFPEGDWHTYIDSPQRAAKKEADQVSYTWDALIEHQSNFIRSGEAISYPDAQMPGPHHERIVRALAAQSRVERRMLSKDLIHALRTSVPGEVFARVKATGSPPTRAFVFVTAAKPADISYEDYRATRAETLAVYCHAVKDGLPTLQEAIGIASEPFSEDASSQDFIHADLAGMSPTEIAHWRKRADEIGILRGDSHVRLSRSSERQFPAPFSFSSPGPIYLGDDGRPLNRAERRKQQREERRGAKKRR